MLSNKITSVLRASDSSHKNGQQQQHMSDGEFAMPGPVLVSDVKAAADRRLTKLRLTQAGLHTVAASRAFLNTVLDKGTVIYGINTGFGGSADVRCRQYEDIQK